MLGTDLAQRFLQSFDVIGAGRGKNSSPDIPYEQLDLIRRDEVEKLLLRHRPDVVFHCAAMTDVDRCERSPAEAMTNNVGVTENIARACEKTKSFLVFFSTDYVFDGKKKGEYLESDSPAPQSKYGKSKYLAEKCLAESQSAFVIFRACWLYGRQGKSFPRTIMSRSEDTEKFQIVSDQVGRPTYTKDIASSLYDLFRKDQQQLTRYSGEIFHIANQGSCSWADFAREVFRLAGKNNVSVEEISSETSNRPAARPANSVMSLKKAEEKLGLRLRNWKEAVREFVPVLMKEMAEA